MFEEKITSKDTFFPIVSVKNENDASVSLH